MLLEFNVQKLEKAIDSFCSSMGVSISILYEDYSVIGSKKLNNPYCHLIQGNKSGLAKCMDSNYLLLERCRLSKKPEMHICHAGLVEMAVPIIHDSDVIGYVSFGHIKMGGQEDLKALISDLPVDTESAQRIYNSLPEYDREKIEAIINMAEIFITYLMSERLLKPRENENFEAIRRYVLENVEKKLTAQTIAAGTHLSKTALYNVIKKTTGNSVNEYINSVKIDRSKSLLLETEMSVDEIAEGLGFSSAGYYAQLFKKFEGISPSIFRKTKL